MSSRSINFKKILVTIHSPTLHLQKDLLQLLHTRALPGLTNAVGNAASYPYAEGTPYLLPGISFPH